MARLEHPGKDHRASVLMRMLHPSKLIRDKFPNASSNDRLDNLKILRRDVKKINRVNHLAIVMIHEDFPEEELYCTERFIRIIEEGDSDYFFHHQVNEEASTSQATNGINTNGSFQLVPVAMPEVCLKNNIRPDDPDVLNAIELSILCIDDYNAPAPEIYLQFKMFQQMGVSIIQNGVMKGYVFEEQGDAEIMRHTFD